MCMNSTDSYRTRHNFRGIMSYVCFGGTISYQKNLYNDKPKSETQYCEVSNIEENREVTFKSNR